MKVDYFLNKANSTLDSLDKKHKHLSLKCEVIETIEKKLKDSFIEYNKIFYESMKNSVKFDALIWGCTKNSKEVLVIVSKKQQVEMQDLVEMENQVKMVKTYLIDIEKNDPQNLTLQKQKTFFELYKNCEVFGIVDGLNWNENARTSVKSNPVFFDLS